MIGYCLKSNYSYCCGKRKHLFRSAMIVMLSLGLIDYRVYFTLPTISKNNF